MGGETDANNFPNTPGTIQLGFGGVSDGFVTKLNSTGTTTLFSTYLGGSSPDNVTAVALDSSNNVYVTGVTVSTDFPRKNPIQSSCGGGCAADDAFVTEINAAGTSLVYSSFLGGSGKDDGLGIAVDSTGAAYVTGLTQSTDFPTVTAFQGALATGATQNAFVTKVNPAGNALVYSTYFGGNSKDAAVGIALDNANNAYFTGLTSSTNFPTKGAFQATCGGSCAGGTTDAFVAALNNSGNGLIYSSYLGGSGNEDCLSGTLCDSPTGDIAVDRTTTNVYITGVTASNNFPTTTSPVQGNFGGGVSDAFVAKVVPSFSLTATAPLPNPVSTGSSATTTVTMQFDPGFPTTTNVALTCSGPSGITCTPNPASVTSATPTSTVTINVSTSATAGTSSITITGTGGSMTQNVTVSLTVQVANFSITASTLSPNPVARGSSATATITLTSVAGFNSSVALTCTGQTSVTCLLNPAAVTPVPAPGATSTLTVNVSSTASLGPPSWRRDFRLFYVLWLPISGLALMEIGLGSLRLRKKKLLALLLGLSVFAGLVFLIACGSSSSNKGGGVGGPMPYTVTVTGTGGSVSNNVTVSGTFQ